MCILFTFCSSLRGLSYHLLFQIAPRPPRSLRRSLANDPCVIRVKAASIQSPIRTRVATTSDYFLRLYSKYLCLGLVSVGAKDNKILLSLVGAHVDKDAEEKHV